VARSGYWIGWSVIALAGTAYLGFALFQGDRRMFLPGRTTAAHYQIEAACAACHTPFAGVTAQPCLRCHGDELTAADDSHPASKFTDPRNAPLLEILDARSCVSCHREHNDEITGAVGVTLPDDFCVRCHQDVGKERPTHAGLTFDTCGSGGCHNYHDNTALYQDFLLKHTSEPAVLPGGNVPDRTIRAQPAERLSAGDRDAPASVDVDAAIVSEWEASAHARAGVNCTGCHVPGTRTDGHSRWVERPTERACASCHDGEAKGFLAGKHGMRLANGLAPMTPALGRLPMKASAAGVELSCSQCHSSHGFDTAKAAVDACLACHDDAHSRAYIGSPHEVLWTREIAGNSRPGTGVSCATCHLPRDERAPGTVLVEHNQNATLRPNEKMVRTVCLRCHGLAFSLDALADTALIRTSFRGWPAHQVDSIEMATRHAKSASP
jgi:predicted CXXCH cytochrome family protein